MATFKKLLLFDLFGNILKGSNAFSCVTFGLKNKSLNTLAQTSIWFGVFKRKGPFDYVPVSHRAEKVQFYIWGKQKYFLIGVNNP